MTPIELRDLLQTDLEGLIGTYTTTNGKVYPAIRIYPPRVDQSWKVEGVEVTIYESPDNSETLPLTGEKLLVNWWIVKLVQWDESSGLSEVINRIQTYFPRVQIINKPSTIENFQTAIVSIYCPEFLGVSRCLE